MKTLGVFILLSWLPTSFAFAQQNEQQKDTIQKLDEVTVSAQQILGSKFQARNRTGSAYYISWRLLLLMLPLRLTIFLMRLVCKQWRW